MNSFQITIVSWANQWQQDNGFENGFYGSHHELDNRYVMSVPKMTRDIFRFSQAHFGPFLIRDLSPRLHQE